MLSSDYLCVPKLRVTVYFFIHANGGLSLPEWLPAPFSLQKDRYSFLQCLLPRRGYNLAITGKKFKVQKSNFVGEMAHILIFPGKFNYTSLHFFIKNWLQSIPVHPQSDRATPSHKCCPVAPVVVVVAPVAVKGFLAKRCPLGVSSALRRIDSQLFVSLSVSIQRGTY